MPSYRRKLLTCWLPPTPCTPDMREQMVNLANESGRSLADLQRNAIALFLQNNDRTSISNDIQPIKSSDDLPPAA